MQTPAPITSRLHPLSRSAQRELAALQLLASLLALVFAVGGVALAWVGVGSAALPCLLAAAGALAAGLLVGRSP